MINPNKTASIRLLGEVDISELKKKVLGLSSAVWAKHNVLKPNKFRVLNRTEHIVFRFINSYKDHRLYSDKAIWEEWKEIVEPILEATKNAYGFKNAEYPRILLAKLPAGETIRPHIDGSLAAKFPHKVHIPIVTNDFTLFFVERVSMKMEIGKIYEVNNLKYHSVENKGATDRIHLIFEIFESANE